MNTTNTQIKSIPKLRFHEFNLDWQEKRLGDVTKINQGLQIAISDRYLEKVPNSYFYITNEFLKPGSEDQYYIVNPPKSVLATNDDMLMTRTGNTGIVVTGVSGAFHNNFFKIKRDEGKITKDFLFYFLNLRSTQNLILRLAGTSTIPDLNHSDFYKISIRLPSLQEQQKIADFLTAVDEKIEGIAKLVELLKKYKKGIMQKVFSQEIRFKDEDGKEFPDWEEKKLGDLLEYEQPTKYIVGDSEYNESYKTPVLTAGKTFILGYTSETDGVFSTVPVIIFDDFTTASQLVNFPFKVKSSALKILRAKKDVNIKIAYELLKRIKFSAENHKRYWIGEFQDFYVNSPTKVEQDRIADFLTSIYEKIEAEERRLAEAKNFKKSLLQQMFV